MLLAGSEVLPPLNSLLSTAGGTPPPPWPPIVPLIVVPVVLLLELTPGGSDAILPRPRLGGMGGGVSPAGAGLGAERPLVSVQLSWSLSPVLVET